jgi:hypothetical protein
MSKGGACVKNFICIVAAVSSPPHAMLQYDILCPGGLLERLQCEVAYGDPKSNQIKSKY